MLKVNTIGSINFRDLTPDELEVVSGGDDINVSGSRPTPPPGGGGLSGIALQELFGLSQQQAIAFLQQLMEGTTEEAPGDEGTNEEGEIIVEAFRLGTNFNAPSMQSFREYFLPLALASDVNPFSLIYFNFGNYVIVIDPSTGIAGLHGQTQFPSPNNFQLITPVHNITYGISSGTSTGISGTFPFGASATFTAEDGTVISFTIGPRPN